MSDIYAPTTSSYSSLAALVTWHVPTDQISNELVQKVHLFNQLLACVLFSRLDRYPYLL